MEMKLKQKVYADFQQFYVNEVEPHIKNNPSYIRLDGRIYGSSRKVFGYFIYDGIKWKVDEDTQINKIHTAYQLLPKNPFEIADTKNKKGKCLIIKGEPLSKKKFYVYTCN